MKTSAIIIAVLFFFASAVAQNIEIQNSSSKSVRSLTKSSKSKEIKINGGQTYSMTFSMKSGKTYMLKIDGAKNLGDVQYRIKGLDAAGNETILYDNSIDEFRDKIVFKSNFTGKAVLEVITQPAVFSNSKSAKEQVGILIAYN